MDPSAAMARALGIVGVVEEAVSWRGASALLPSPNLLTRLSGRYERSVSAIANQLTTRRRDGVKIVDKSLTRC